MKTEIQLTEQQQAFLQLVENVPNYWAQYPLPDLTDFENFNRKLVVVGFGVTPVENGNSEMLSMKVNQIFTRKTDGTVYKTKSEEEWFITKNDKTTPSGTDEFIKVTKIVTDDEGNEISSEIVDWRIPSIKYIKFLLLNKQAHLTDILTQFMALYYATFKNEIDLI